MFVLQCYSLRLLYVAHWWLEGNEYLVLVDGGASLVEIHTPQFLDGNDLFLSRREQVGKEFSRCV